MQKISIHITVECPEEQHLAVSSFVKTMMQAMDVAVEGKDPQNDFKFKATGTHPEAVTMNPPESHPLRKPFGL